MPIEDVFSISGARHGGDGACGAPGVIKVGEEVEIVGIPPTRRRLHGRGDVPQSCWTRAGWETTWACCCAVLKRDEVGAWAGTGEAEIDYAAYAL